VRVTPDPISTIQSAKLAKRLDLDPAAQRPRRTMPFERILICGAGVAGSILAFWLAKHDFQVVVVERSKTEQKAGQGIEIEEPALKIVKAMGILDELNEKKTGEMGFKSRRRASSFVWHFGGWGH